MNQKLIKFIRREGYCCLWAWLEVNRKVYTSELVKVIGPTCTQRALQQQRAKHRHKETACTECSDCLKKKITQGHTISVYPRIDP